MSDSDQESTRQSQGRDNNLVQPAADEANNDDEENVIEQLYGDEREQYDDEDDEDGENLFGDDMMRFLLYRKLPTNLC